MSLTDGRSRHAAELLCQAILDDNILRFNTLLSSGADPNIICLHGVSAMHIAAGVESHSEYFTSELLRHSANPNLRNNDGTTPILIAASYGHCEALKMLIKAGGDVNLPDFDGNTALELARLSGCETCCHLVTKSAADECSHNSKYDFSYTSDISLNEHFVTCCSLDNLSSLSLSGILSNDELSNLNTAFYDSDVYYDTSSDLTSVSSLSKQSSCSKHSVRIEQHLVVLDDSSCSLVETHFIPDLKNSLQDDSLNCSSQECKYLKDKQLALHDWITSSSKSADCITVCDVAKLSIAELRAKLVAYGESPGPIVASTRRTYEQRLLNYMTGDAIVKGRTSEFASELSAVLDHRLSICSLEHLEEDISSMFSNPDPSKQWREGIQKCCFNYLLMDPRVTQNLPVRAKGLGTDESFKTFLRAIFYVGKGKRSRPYEHFKEAVTYANSDKTAQPCRKVAQILEIWQAGLGVISLHVFQNVIACEAYTREACMIDALGLERLANQCRGQLYGVASTWSAKTVRQTGVILLYKVFNIFLYEGERQIRMEDTKH